MRKHAIVRNAFFIYAVARSETNLPALTNTLVSVVQETVHPEEVKLWLKP